MVIRIAFFLLVGVLLVGANVWFVMAVTSAFFDRQVANQIAPFRIIGREDKEGTLGLAMAHQLQARLALLQRDLEVSQLTEEEHPLNAPFRPLGIPLRQIKVPDQVFSSFDITLKIAGVEVGGVLSSLYRVLTAPEVLDFVVEFQEQQAIIVGNLNLLGGPPLYIRATPTADEIVTSIAYAIYQRTLARNLEHVNTLELQNFRDLMETLEEAIRLNAKVRSQTARREDFQALLPRLRETVRKTPRWREIVRLTAEIAENAESTAEAVALYRQELALVEPDSLATAEILDRIARLDKTLQVAAAEPSVKTQNQGTILKQLRDSPWGKTLLETVRIPPRPAPDLASSPTIALLGPPPPPDLLPVSQCTILREDSRGSEYETQYVTDLVRLILVVAPSARFLFTSVASTVPGGYSEPEIVEALTSLLDASPDILLVTYGPLWGPRFTQIFREAGERGTLVLLGAYSPSSAWQQRPLKVFPDTLTIGGLTRDQAPVQPLPQGFSPGELLWTAGQDLPTVSSAGRIEPKTGHSYAAAIAAGLLWHVKDAGRDFRPGEIIQVLQRTSHRVGEGFATIDLPAALAEVQERSAELSISPLVREVNAPIPDNDPHGITSVQNVSEQGLIRRIQVAVDISHTYIGDLVVALIPPQGQPILLHNRQGGSADNIRRTYSTELAPLIGSDARGEWKLQVSDHSARDIGSLNRWTLEIGLVE